MKRVSTVMTEPDLMRQAQELTNFAKDRYKVFKDQFPPSVPVPTEAQFIATYLIAHHDVMERMAMGINAGMVPGARRSKLILAS